MLYYVGTYYSDLIEERKPMGSRAENYKMEYIISAIKKAGLSLKVISAIGYQKNGFFGNKKCIIDKKEEHIYLGNFSSQKRGLSKFGVITRLVVLFFYLLFNAGSNDTVLIYNTPIFSLPIRIAKRIKKFEAIVQIEELFYYEKNNKRSVKFEKAEKKLIKMASKYIVANDIIHKKLCNNGKKGIIAYGPYFVPIKRTDRFEDGRYHIVYGGGYDYLRRVDLAVKAMDYLDDSYYLDIFAFGDSKAMCQLKELVDITNKKYKSNRITMHDPLSGDDYTTFLQKCHIGLNLQEAGSDFDEMAFPSKISTYLGCGLNVVSSSLKSIRSSRLDSIITYYDHTDEVSIAEAIRKCTIKDYDDIVSIMHDLDKKFVKSLMCLLDSNSN
ncbi:hypothetical protein [Ruminococcus flavefaciens]|uniref:hypothetical protein n=1 Tax=Ruminococcus flavefaciens TaxID=1265 RepID=UPI00048E399D|nr:hypothetical protein [Ruminococcus flavefaciens]